MTMRKFQKLVQSNIVEPDAKSRKHEETLLDGTRMIKVDSELAYLLSDTKNCFRSIYRKIRQSTEYGPPYFNHQNLEKTFLEEIERDRRNISLKIIHICLSNKINPNLYENESEVGNRALHFAAKSCNIRLGEMLLSAGAMPHQKNKLGQTPLMIAVYSKSKQNKSFIDLIMREPGFDQLDTDRGGNTLLAHSVKASNLYAVKLMLRHDKPTATLSSKNTSRALILQTTDIIELAKKVSEEKNGICLKTSKNYFARFNERNDYPKRNAQKAFESIPFKILEVLKNHFESKK